LRTVIIEDCYYSHDDKTIYKYERGYFLSDKKNYSKPIVLTKEVAEDGCEKYFINFDVDGFNL